METFETIKSKNYVADIIYDDDCPSPRDAEWADNFGTLIAFHSRYNLSDSDAWCEEELLDHVNCDDIFALPVYIYEHGSISLSTSEFMCKWDSGQVGYIFASHEDIVKEFGELDLKKAEKLFDSELETYTKYLNGECFGYTISYKNADDQDYRDIDSCWGFIGSEYIKEEVNAILKHLEEK